MNFRRKILKQLRNNKIFDHLMLIFMKYENKHGLIRMDGLGLGFGINFYEVINHNLTK